MEFALDGNKVRREAVNKMKLLSNQILASLNTIDLTRHRMFYMDIR